MRLADQLKKKESNAQCRIPALILHGDDAQKFESLVAASDLSATKLAAKLIGHVLSTDTSIKELLESQSTKPSFPKKIHQRSSRKKYQLFNQPCRGFMASKVARLTDSADTAAVPLLSQLHSRTAEPSELLPLADNTDFCAAAHHICGRLQRPLLSSCASHSASCAHFEIKLPNVKSAGFLRPSSVVAVTTQSDGFSSLGLSARFMNHTPRKSFGLALVLICAWMTIHPSCGDSFLKYSK